MLRELALSGLEWAGISVDGAANDAAVRGRTGEVQGPGSPVKVGLVQNTALQAAVWVALVSRIGSALEPAPPHTGALFVWPLQIMVLVPSLPLLPCQQVLVIPTDEQLEIAEQTLEVVRRHTEKLARAA